MKKKLIILFSILGFILTAGGLVATYFIIEGNKAPVELEETEAQFTTTLLEAPTDGSLPTEHEATDVIAYSLWSVANSKEFSVITTGFADAGIAKQQIANERVVKNGEAMISTVSSGMVSVATQRFFFKEEENKVLARGATKVKDAIATWDSEHDPECVTYKEMKKRYGWYPFQANGYIICESTYLDKENINVISNNDGTYNITFSLDPDGEKAPFWYRREIITSSGSTIVPTFSSIEITFKIDKNYRLLSQNIKETYTVRTMGVEATTETDVIDEFSYEDVKFNQEYYDWFMQYRGLAPKADSLSDEIEAKKDDIMTMVVSSLQTESNRDLNLKLNVNLNDLIKLDGLVALNINDLKNVRVKTTLGDYFYEDYYNNTFYVRINDAKYKLDLSDLILDADAELDVDKIVNDLNSGTIVEDGNNIKITSAINLFGADLNLFFDITNNSGNYSLNYAIGNININGFSVDLSIEKTDSTIDVIDHSTFSDFDVNTLIENITKIVNDKELGIDLNLEYKDINIHAYGDISFKDDLFMNLNLDINYNNLDIKLNAIYDNDIIYISYDDINVSINKDDILYIVNLFTDSIDFNLDSIKDILKNYDIFEIISNIHNLTLNPVKDETVIEVSYKDIDISLNALNRSVNKEFDKTKYNSLSSIFELLKQNITKDDINNLIDNVKKIINEKELALDLDLSYDLLDIKANGAISFKDDLFINLDLDIKYNELDMLLNVCYTNDNIYVKYDGLKIKVSKDSILNVVEALLGTKEISIDNIANIIEPLIGEINILDIINNIKNIDINATSNSTNILFEYDKLNLELDINNINVNKEFDDSNYMDLSGLVDKLSESINNDNKDDLINIVKKVITIAKEKEFNINLDLSIYDNDIKHLDVNGNILFYIYENGRFDLEINGNIIEYNTDLTTKMVHSIDLKLISKEYFIKNNIDGYNKDYLFITYGTNPNSPNNLIKMYTPAEDLLSVVGTLTKLLNIDLSFLNNYSTFDFNDIDTEQIKNLFSSNTNLTNIDFNNLLNEMIIGSDKLELDLNLSELLNTANASTKLVLSVEENDNYKAYIKLDDLYIKEETKLDVNKVSLLKDSVNITLSNVDSSWYDISSIDELVAGLLVTASNKSYEISGEVTLEAGGFFNALSIPFVVKVNVFDDGSFALYANLNYDKSLLASTVIKGKETSFYYMDGYIIIDAKYKGGFMNLSTYHESVKVTVEEFLGNIKYYIFDFGMRLSDLILDSMDSSTTNDNVIDASLVLEDYSSNGKDYNIALNIGELSGISGMGTLSTTISLDEILYNDINVDAIISISSLSLDMFDILEITLNNPITLTNVKEVDGHLMFTDVDMSEYINYFNNYNYKIGEIHTY